MPMVSKHDRSSSPGDYSAALRLLLSLADFERMAGLAPPLHKPDMGRMEELSRRMGHPHKCAPVVHVAGTKGKGSVAAMVASILKAAGLRTGLFTSPHLHTFTERIRMDGSPIDEEKFAYHLGQVWQHVEAMGSESAYGKPSTFEVLTAMAFDLFRAERVDVQVLEVGLGGRLDSTNVAVGQVAVITSLSLDHTAVLGDHVALIASEKAGIIKPGARVVLSPQEPEAEAVVVDACRRLGVELWRLGHDVTWQTGPADLAGQQVNVRTPSRTYDLTVPLLGVHQRENAAAAVAAVEAMDLNVSVDEVVRGVRDVEWQGRFQVLSTSPYLVVDGAHNPYSMKCLSETVREYLGNRRVVVVFGCSSDKDVAGMVAQMAPIAERSVVCTSRHPRAVPVQQLKELFEGKGVGSETAEDVAAALDAALAQAADDDVVLVTGSLFVVAEALQSWFGLQTELYPELEPPSSVGSGVNAHPG
jgi:dihydrofolate synthase/folylpolyglutamate synthase